MNQQRKIIKSYTSVFRIERKFHGFGGVTFPIAFSFNSVIYWGLAAFIMHYIGWWIPSLMRYFIIPGVLAWVFDQKLLDGKSPFQFARSIVIYYYILLVKGGRISRYRYYKKEKPVMHVNASYRVHKEKP